jgi:hypothetical protein
MGYAHATHRGTPAPRSGTPSPPDYPPGTHRTGSLPPRKPATRPASRTPCLPKRPQPCPRTARGRLPPPRPAPRLPRPTNRAHDGSRLAARPGVADRWGGRAGSLLILCSCRSPLPQAVGDSGTPQPEPPSCHSPSSQAAADSGTPQPEPPSCHSPSPQAAADSGTPQPEPPSCHSPPSQAAGDSGTPQPEPPSCHPPSSQAAGDSGTPQPRKRPANWPPLGAAEAAVPRSPEVRANGNTPLKRTMSALIKQMRHAVLPGSAVGYLMGVVRGGTPLTSRHWLSQRRVTARA